MYKNKAQKHSKKKMMLLILGAVLALLLVLFVLEKTNTIDIFKSSTNRVSSSDGPTEEQKKQEAQIAADTKKQFIDSQKDGPGSNTPAGDSTQSSTIDLSAKQESNNTVTIFTKLAGYSSGSCKLVLANGSKSKTQIADIIYQPEYSTCAGFSIPVSDLGVGDWNLQLSIQSNGQSAKKSLIFKAQ